MTILVFVDGPNINEIAGLLVPLIQHRLNGVHAQVPYTVFLGQPVGGTGGGTQDIDLQLGNSVSATVDTSTNTFTFSDPTASDELCGFTLTLVNGGSQTVNWPGSVDWAGGTAPTLTTSGTDILTFFTINGGTLWHGMIASADSK